MTEHELRTQISRSEKDGFRLLLQEYHAYVYTVIWNRIGAVGSREDAEEAVSDVFADIFLHFGDIREGSLQGYIGTVSKRTAIDWYRRLAASPVCTGEEELPDIPDKTDIPAEHERVLLRSQLLDAVESLGQPDASIILQKYYYDRNFREIAQSLHMAQPAVRMRASRALKRLRKLLGEAFNPKGGA